MNGGPQKEHAWLEQLTGDWVAESECSMGPDQPSVTTSWTETGRLLHGMWLVSEGIGDTPGGGSMTAILTLGFDPARDRYVGTFIASMMTHMWVYEGTLDAAGKVLTLDTEGPNFAVPGTMARYQDIIELFDDGRRELRSRMLGPDGTWHPVMNARYRRT